ncbi:deoxyguanosine kinase [Kurthia zopfii]|uniref:Deoxyguanosine kinase n=1 Tax=Kurthia zopfii TaxID=1650 RepID=A0A2U3A9M2_9BACL|nr:deoxynucleoside kinase [Kurthia zopfii]PWI21200.1 deoxynucleoside kinase [Kurthia zopfii]TDR33489.1 deoxyguanosine kinase [Kurthia zopfii]STX08387.1 Deoxyguanosine kinase [Kurthia zopfii]VEI05367.1 Deoxyguanosine kinase [Kurthia zopfii]GEK32212.1 deoxyguanosine kinase [Kurthia zopfii]
MPVPFIAVEGPIGVGKTSLSSRIAENFGFDLLKEIVDENPFLNKFYEDIDEWSFQTEMFFLCNRYKQLKDVKKTSINLEKPVVADYHVFKNLIFAKRTLQEQEYDKYEKIYEILISDMVTPNAVIYLEATVDTLMQRIAMRGREFEKMIKRDYMEQLVADYKEYIDRFERENPSIPVLRINGDACDFVKNEYDLQKILREVEELIGKRSINQ